MESGNAPAQTRGSWLRKSQSGCGDCRLRKVKCDEIRPVCSNCRRRYVNIQSCDWRINTRRTRIYKRGTIIYGQSSDKLGAQDPSGTATGSQLSSLQLQPSTVANTDQWRSIELRLIYHYTAVVSHTMPDCLGAGAKIWQRTMPQLAFESEVVLNPILALSALHLYAYSPESPIMATTLGRYIDKSLANHRKALSDGEGLSEQLWLSAVLISHMYWLLAHQSQPHKMYELPLQAYRLLDGVGTLFTRERIFLRRLNYGSFHYEAMPPVMAEDELAIDSQMQLQSVKEDLIYLLDTFEIQVLSEVDRSVYTAAKDYVLHNYRSFYSGTAANTLRRFVLIMAVRCHLGYRKMLERHDPLAVALLARMLVLLCGLDHAWWVNGQGDFEVMKRDVRGIYELMPAKCLWAMDWPMKVLDGEIVLRRDL